MTYCTKDTVLTSENAIIAKAFRDTYGDTFHQNQDAAYAVFKDAWKQALSHHAIEAPTLFSQAEWGAITEEAVKANPQVDERFYELTATEILTTAEEVGFNPKVKGNIIDGNWLIKFSHKLYLKMLLKK